MKLKIPTYLSVSERTRIHGHIKISITFVPNNSNCKITTFFRSIQYLLFGISAHIKNFKRCPGTATAKKDTISMHIQRGVGNCYDGASHHLLNAENDAKHYRAADAIRPDLE